MGSRSRAVNASAPHRQPEIGIAELRVCGTALLAPRPPEKRSLSTATPLHRMESLGSVAPQSEPLAPHGTTRDLS